jgi:hypothetical protein
LRNIMRTCSYCGRDNIDEALNCRECGTELPDGNGFVPDEIPNATAPFCGNLSIAAPFLSGLIVCILWQTDWMDRLYYVPYAGWAIPLMILAPLLLGISFAAVARRRRERFRKLWLIGATLNVGTLLLLFLYAFASARDPLC